MKNNISFTAAHASPAVTIGRFDNRAALSDCWKVMKKKLLMTQANDPQSIHGSGILAFLTSRKNDRAGRLDVRDAQDLETKDGKQYRMIRQFRPRSVPTAHKSSSWQFCNTKGKQPNKMVEDTIKIRYEYISPVLELDHARLKCIEEGKAEYENDAIQTHLHEYLQGLASITSELVANPANGYIGTHAGNLGNNGKVDIPVFNKAGNNFNPAGIILMEEYLALAGAPGQPCLIGSSGKISAMAKLGKYLTAGSCAGIDGARIGDEYEGIVIKDNYVGALLQDPDCVLAIVPGALKFVSKVDFVGDFEISREGHVRSTVIDPWFDLEHDVVMNENWCGKYMKRSIQYGICFDVIGYPKCWNNDPCFKGITDVYMFRLTCADTGICNSPTLKNCLPISSKAMKSPDNCEPNAQCDEPCKALGIVSADSDCNIIFNSLSCASTGENVSNLKWELDNGTVVEGLPTDAASKGTGTVGVFLMTPAEVDGAKEVTLTITDSKGCSSSILIPICPCGETAMTTDAPADDAPPVDEGEGKKRVAGTEGVNELTTTRRTMNAEEFEAYKKEQKEKEETASNNDLTTGDNPSDESNDV